MIKNYYNSKDWHITCHMLPSHFGFGCEKYPNQNPKLTPNPIFSNPDQE